MSKKSQFWRELELFTIHSIASKIGEAHQVRVYPSRKHAGIIMIKIRDYFAEYTGQIADTDFEKLADALKPFTPAPDKKATVYSRKPTVETRLYLEYVCSSIEASGFTPASKESPTWKTALELYYDHQPLSPSAIARADEVIEAMRQAEDSEFGRRLAKILESTETILLNLAVLASASIALDRRRAREAAAAVSQHVGSVGEWIEVDFLEMTFTRIVETRYDPMRLWKFRDTQNNQYTIWMDARSALLPDRFAGRVRVAAHKEYQGVKETVIEVTPAGIHPIETCPACGGRYDAGACTCIAEPSLYTFEPGEFDVEIEG